MTKSIPWDIEYLERVLKREIVKTILPENDQKLILKSCLEKIANIMTNRKIPRDILLIRIREPDDVDREVNFNNGLTLFGRNTEVKSYRITLERSKKFTL